MEVGHSIGYFYGLKPTEFFKIKLKDAAPSQAGVERKSEIFVM
jgi:hypothetical protein